MLTLPVTVVFDERVVLPELTEMLDSVVLPVVVVAEARSVLYVLVGM